MRGNLTALQRATIGALVVVDVHARDVVTEMVNDKVRRSLGWALVRHFWGFRGFIRHYHCILTLKAADFGSLLPLARLQAELLVPHA